jgi:hypothetical protein
VFARPSELSWLALEAENVDAAGEFSADALSMRTLAIAGRPRWLPDASVDVAFAAGDTAFAFVRSHGLLGPRRPAGLAAVPQVSPLRASIDRCAATATGPGGRRRRTPRGRPRDDELPEAVHATTNSQRPSTRRRTPRGRPRYDELPEAVHATTFPGSPMTFLLRHSFARGLFHPSAKDSPQVRRARTSNQTVTITMSTNV